MHILMERTTTAVKRVCNFLLVGVILLVLGVGCGKEDASTTATTDTLAPGSPEAAQRDMVIAQRKIDYIQGLVERGDYPKAREALNALEGQALTPAQKKVVDGLKARIPSQ